LGHRKPQQNIPKPYIELWEGGQASGESFWWGKIFKMIFIKRIGKPIQSWIVK
jgi:hypothetical protein